MIWVAIVCFVLALICLPIWIGMTEAAAKHRANPPQFGSENDAYWRTGVGWTGIGLGLLAGLFAFISCIAIVGIKEVGIITTFNKPVGELDNGFHLINPFSSVTEMDAAIQTDDHLQVSSSCVSARIAHQITACVDVIIRWRIQPNSADELFQDYRDFGNVRISLVTRELSTDVNNEMATYDPLAVDSEGNSSAPPLSSLSASVLSDMQTQIGRQIEVLSVFIPVMHFDPAVQGRLNALQAQIAQTRIAQQAELTAQAQAAANKALSASVSNDPNVLVSRCLDLVTVMINNGHALLPAGFSCWPGGSTGIVIPAR